MTREEWLLAGVELFRDRLPVLPPVKVSVGFPKGGSKKVGQAWNQKLSGDERTVHIFISPSVEQPDYALGILLHELIHAAVGIDAKHGKPFRQEAEKQGLEKPWTSTSPSESLYKELKALAKELGTYPHVGLAQPTKQKTRLKLWECSCEPPVKIRRAGDLNAQCLDCGQLFERRDT